MRKSPLRRQPPHSAEKLQGREHSILVASDWAPIRAFEPLIQHDPEAIYGDMLPVLRAADLRIVNCECALTSRVKPVWKSGAAFKGDPGHVTGLTVVPFEVACLANNHVFDYGVEGFRESLRVLHQQGIKTVGAGLTEEQAHEPLTITIGNSTVSIINISEGEDLTAAHGGPGVSGWDIARARAQVALCKMRGACVIVIAHCGLEYIPYPPNYVVAAFRALIDAGADCVVGHHPHVPQGIEWHRGRPIAYSLGNFVFYQTTNLYYRRMGFCVGLRIAGSTVAGIRMYPYRITESGISALNVSEAREFQRKMARISRPLNTPGGAAKAWNAYLAYYGMEGFCAEVQTILKRMESEPQKGAAMFRNRITTPQHYELWRDILSLAMDGKKEAHSKTAFRIVEEWFTRTI